MHPGRSGEYGGQMRWIGWCLALALLVAGCSGSSSHHQAIGVPPQKVAGIYVCPDGAAFVAYGHSVYPPNYPSPPARTVPPSRCFASMEQAASAGYGLARPPRGGRVVGGVYLVRPPASLAGLCERSATKAGIT